MSDTHCPCGRSLPLLAEIDGRSTDFVRAADGTVVHGLALIYVLRELPQIEELKIVQESVISITVQLVTSTNDTAHIESTITEQFRRRLGDSLLVRFDYVSSIEREASGKFRYVISQITG